MARITINGNSFDPATAARTALSPSDKSRSNYILVQTKTPITKPQRGQLSRLGVTILEYVPTETYVAFYKGRDLTPIRRLAFVSWCDVYLRGFKIAPSLLAPSHPKVRNFGVADALPHNFSRALRRVDIVFHVGVSPESVRNKIAEIVGLDSASLKMGQRKVRLQVEERVLAQLAALDEVRHIEEVQEYQLNNNVARVILGLDASSSGGSGTSAFEGDGQIIGIADTGFDKGDANDVHPAFTGRVANLYALGRPGDSSDTNGHGTHVCGSALGDGDSAVLNLKIRGTAPKANLVLQSLLDSNGGLGGIPADLHDLFTPPYNNDNVRVHSNSWGTRNSSGVYNANCQELDDFVWNNRDCVICFAAGNDGTDADADGVVDPNSVNPPAVAKNCVAVGATENNRPDKTDTYGQIGSRFPADPIHSDLIADNPDGMAAFSSRGPVANSRNKPDVVAPGTFVLSTRSRKVTNITKSVGKEASADNLFFFDTGTSMATPLVAGCAALVREYLANEKQMNTPSAALVKAILINGATPIVGQYSPPEVSDPPDISQGFGRVNIPTTVGPFDPSTIIVLKDESHELDTGQRRWYSVPVLGGHTLLKVTLVWTDMPGDTLQNDLDLTVLGANQEQRGGNGTTPPDHDQVNNVEQVIWNDPPAGKAVIRVSASRITSNPQSYALVIRVE